MSSSSGRSKGGDRAGEKKCSGCGGGGAAHICPLEDLPGPAHIVIASMLPDGDKWGGGNGCACRLCPAPYLASMATPSLLCVCARMTTTSGWNRWSPC